MLASVTCACTCAYPLLFISSNLPRKMELLETLPKELLLLIATKTDYSSVCSMRYVCKSLYSYGSDVLSIPQLLKLLANTVLSCDVNEIAQKLGVVDDAEYLHKLKQILKAESTAEILTPQDALLANILYHSSPKNKIAVVHYIAAPMNKVSFADTQANEVYIQLYKIVILENDTVKIQQFEADNPNYWRKCGHIDAMCGFIASRQKKLL